MSIDWTRNPIKAAFFAASSVDAASEYIAVYAVRLIYFEWDKVKRVLPPWSLTPNIHAQEGLFTLDLTSNTFFVEHGRYPSLEESITPPEGYDELDARKLLLPISEVPKLIRLLWLENITAAHLMPTLDNVASALKLKLKAMK